MSPHVLLIGGHGKISILLTPLLLQRSWTVTSVIRSSSQKSDILSAAGSSTANLSVKIHDLEAVTSQADAQALLDETKPDYVVFSAGETPSHPRQVASDTPCAAPISTTLTTYHGRGWR